MFGDLDILSWWVVSPFSSVCRGNLKWISVFFSKVSPRLSEHMHSLHSSLTFSTLFLSRSHSIRYASNFRSLLTSCLLSCSFRLLHRLSISRNTIDTTVPPARTMKTPAMWSKEILIVVADAGFSFSQSLRWSHHFWRSLSKKPSSLSCKMNTESTTPWTSGI